MRVLDTPKKRLTQAQIELSRHRLDLLSSLMPALIQVRSVNSMNVATAIPGPAHKMSRYRRLQRLFNSGASPDVFTPLILDKVIKPGTQLFLTLTMERMPWKLGRTALNLPCLGVLHQDLPRPLEAVWLGQAGNSNTREREKLFREAWQSLKVDSPHSLAKTSLDHAPADVLDRRGRPHILQFSEIQVAQGVVHRPWRYGPEPVEIVARCRYR